MGMQVLWLADNGISELRGLERLAALRELNLARNPLGGPGDPGWARGLAPCAARLRSVNLAATRLHSFLQVHYLLSQKETAGHRPAKGVH